jgi:hypothetical protein
MSKHNCQAGEEQYLHYWSDDEEAYDDEDEDELSRYGVPLDHGEDYAVCLPPPRRREEDDAVYAPCMYSEDGDQVTIYVSAPGIHTMQGRMPMVRLFKRCEHRRDDLKIR